MTNPTKQARSEISYLESRRDKIAERVDWHLKRVKILEELLAQTDELVWDSVTKKEET